MPLPSPKNSYKLGMHYAQSIQRFPLELNKKQAKEHIDNIADRYIPKKNIIHWKAGAYKELGIKTDYVMTEDIINFNIIEDKEVYTEDQYARDTMTVSLLAPFRQPRKGYILKK